jgi:ankyrin repeat protein
MLLAHGAKVKFAPGLRTPLYDAAGAGHLAMVKLLVEHGSDPNAPTRHGKTPFTAAVQNGNIELIKYFLTLGVDVNQQDEAGNAPLHYAILERHKDVAELLLEKGANARAPYHREKETESPVALARRLKDERMATMLVAHGAAE